jgi:hypothetical protein
MIFVLYLYLTTNNWQTNTVTVEAFQTEEACMKAADNARKKYKQVITNCVRMKPI